MFSAGFQCVVERRPHATDHTRECVNYDKTVFILIHVRRAEGSRARNYGWGYARGVRCDAPERVTAASGSILTVGQSGGARNGSGSGAGAGAGAGGPYSCDTAPNETTATATAMLNE
ncbi:hypothetical protein EVAR_62503_1 [Eumeta japonica]|uniref:Uncharacterized protein n=1 Tax=Eumeta variegata TaxID=151549 RepID=A0A4C1SDR3_EUMVA|nr:hypothetical protein EVAR_62503_1 [Eumeta japonica]